MNYISIQRTHVHTDGNYPKFDVATMVIDPKFEVKQW